MRILILTAFEDELIDIKKIFSELHQLIIAKKTCFFGKREDCNILLSCTGIGTASAAHISTVLCEQFQPHLILMCGVAGGLNHNQKIGDLIVGSKIIDADLYLSCNNFLNTPYESCLTDTHTNAKIVLEFKPPKELIDLALSIKINNIMSGTIFTSNVFPLPQSLISNTEQSDASVIEMESVGVYKSAQCYNIPVLTIRVISNLINSYGSDLKTSADSIKICSQRLRIYVEKFLNLQLYFKFLIKEKSEKKRIKEIIVKYNLLQHSEGGWYKQTFESEDFVKVQGESQKRYNGEVRVASTSIIYLLHNNDFSGWHTLQSDEIWNFHAGSALILRIINSKTKSLKTVILGFEQGLLQYTIRAGDVFSAESTGLFSLCGCVVAPGFDFKDFQLLSKSEFETNFPEHISLIRLVRESHNINEFIE